MKLYIYIKIYMKILDATYCCIYPAGLTFLPSRRVFIEKARVMIPRIAKTHTNIANIHGNGAHICIYVYKYCKY